MSPYGDRRSVEGQWTQRLNSHRRRANHDAGRINLNNAGTDPENNLEVGGHRDGSPRINRLVHGHRNVLTPKFDVQLVVAALEGGPPRGAAKGVFADRPGLSISHHHIVVL